MFTASVITVLIASPSDCQNEREAIRRTIMEWNSRRSRADLIVLLPWMYEEDSAPAYGEPAQAVINTQSRHRDITIAVFRSRLGTPTAKYVSGSAEEVMEAHADGKRAAVYFSEEGHPSNVDLDQLARLRNFRKDAEAESFSRTFTTVDDLCRQVRLLLDQEVERFKPELAEQQSPAAQELAEERRRLVRAFRMARAVGFLFTKHPTRPANDGFLQITNGPSGTIHNLTVFEGKLISPDAYIARFVPDEDRRQFETLSPESNVLVHGLWFAATSNSTPYFPTDDELRQALVEMYWTDELGLNWSTDNRGSQAQLETGY